MSGRAETTAGSGRPPLQDGDTHLAVAVARAVEESRAALAAVVSRLAGGLEQAKKNSGHESGAIEELRKQFRAAVEQHERDAGQFTVVLFGRTGAGKSSLVEALTFGDGTSISPGESDCTLEPREEPWGSLTLVDTPGVAGWGRSVPREELERRARAMVRRADLVVLMFDSYGQQADELLIVRDEIARHNRPVLVVLNVRNHGWRSADGKGEGPARAVRQAARYLGRELASLGLSSPVVALNAYHAVESRCRDQGPAGERFPGEEDSSNIQMLEEVVGEALRLGATRLRVQALEEDLRGLLRVAAEGMQVEADQSLDAARAAEDVVARLLWLIGDGSGADPMTGRWDRRKLPKKNRSDVLTGLEKLRGETLGAGPTGTVQEIFGTIIRTVLHPAERDFAARAEEVVLEHIKRAKSLPEKELKARLAPQGQALKAAASQTLDDFADELRQRIDGLELEVLLGRELALGPWKLGDIETTRGQTAAVLAISADVLVSLAPLVALIVVGPIAAAALGLVSFVTGWIRRRVLKRAEASRAQTQAKAIADVSREVARQLADVRSQLWAQVTETLEKVAVDALPPLIDQAIPARRRAQNLGAGAAPLLEATGDPGSMFSAADVLEEAIQRVGKMRGVKGRRHLEAMLLGEHLLDRSGLAEGTGGREDADRAVQQRWDHLADRLLSKGPKNEQKLVRALERRIAEEAASLRTPTRRRLTREPDHGQLFVTLIGPGGPPLRRTIAALSRELAQGNVSGTAGGSPRARIRCVGMDDVDGSSRVAASDVVLWLVPPNGVPTRSPLFKALLERGSELRPVVLARSGLVLLGVEGLGADPEREAEAFAGVLYRKAAEFSLLLGESGVDWPQKCMAALVYDSSAAPERPPPAWTGLPSAAAALLRVADGTGSASRRLRHRLVALHDAQQSTSIALEAEVMVTDELHDVHRRLGRHLRAGERLLADGEARLAQAVEERLLVLAMDLFAADGDAFDARRRHFERWESDPVVRQEVKTWEKWFRDEWVRWEEQVPAALEATAEFSARELPGHDTRLPGEVRQARGAGRALRILTAALRKASASRDAWYETVKTVTLNKFKFAPWGAIKGARTAAQAAVVLSVIASVITVAENVVDIRNRKRRDKARHQAVGAARSAAAAVVREYLHGDPALAAGDAPSAGALVPCRVQLACLADHDKQLAAQLRRSSRKQERLQRELEALERLGDYVRDEVLSAFPG